jgi:hypothetical protein
MTPIDLPLALSEDRPMLSNADLSNELETLAAQARDLSGQVKNNGDLPPRTLAAALVESAKLGERVRKLGKQLAGGNGKKGK